MKRYLLLLIPLILCSGCKKQNNEQSSSFSSPHYNEVEELHIHWNDLFLQKDNEYYAYVYSVTCPPCSSLREEVITFAKSGRISFYFIYPSDDVPFIEDMELAESSLGATEIEDVYCYSTPTLIGITNKTITYYSRDYYNIKNQIESYME